MSDDAPFIKMPPAAFYDQRLQGNDLRVLAVISERRDFRTDISDFSQEQVCQALRLKRQAVQRACKRLAECGYIVSRGRHPKHNSHFYWVNFANDPRNTGVAVTPGG